METRVRKKLSGVSSEGSRGKENCLFNHCRLLTGKAKASNFLFSQFVCILCFFPFC